MHCHRNFNKTALALAALAYASGAIAQSTSTTMDMGGGMTHVDTMGPNGAMSSSDCMNMGGGMATCNTMDMSQPQRTYPTPDMSRPQRTYTRPDTNAPEPTYTAPYVSRWPIAAAPAPIAPPLSTAVPVAPRTQGNRLITPSPMTLISSKSSDSFLTDEEMLGLQYTSSTTWDGLGGGEKTDTLYSVIYLGHILTTYGPTGLSIDNLRTAFDKAWRDNPWVEYSSTDAGTVYYFSITSERVYTDRIEVWVKADHSKDRTTKARTSKILYEVKCGDQTIRELLSIEYDSHGKVLSSFDYPGTAQRIIPETVGNSLHEEMCKFRS